PRLRNVRRSVGQRRNINHRVSAIQVRGHADGVATPLIANRRNVNGRSTMPATDVLSILPVAFRATDAAGIQRHSPSVGLLNDHESQRLPTRIYGEQMQASILNFAYRPAHHMSR